jgi:DNA-binding NtrC family response regulator
VKPRILAIDDETDMLRLLERIITEKTPYQIETVSNSLEISEMLAQRTYDVILTDLRMPGFDGMDVLRLVKDQDRDEVVVVITAFGSLDNAQQTLALGAFEYLTKPVRNEQLIFTLNRAMHWKRIKREAHLLRRICAMEPFAEAAEAFRREYVERLAERYGADTDELAGVSGISPDTLDKLLRASEEIE